MLILSVLLSVFIAATQPSPSTQPEPAGTTRLVYHYVSPKVKPGTFQAQPRVVYRADRYHLRIEEPPDEEQRIHGIIICNNRDSWMINLFDRSAIHIRDDGPTFESHDPIVSGLPHNDPAWQFEMARELEFMREHGKRSAKTGKWSMV